MRLEKRTEFLQKFKNKYPDYEILSFNNVSGPIVFKDSEGFIHKKNNAYRVITHNVRFDSIVNKDEYIQKKLDSLKTGLTLVRFSGIKDKITVQDVNGFTYSPSAYDVLKGHSVSIESCNEKEKLFIYKASIRHKNKYEYGSFVYSNGKQKVPVICPIHGEFTISVESHLFGCGCRKCKNDSASFSISEWVEKFKEKTCTFYILEFYNNSESFIKAGITAVSIKKRYYGYGSYRYNIIAEIKGTSEYICKLEKSFLLKYKKFKYSPLEKFDGRTECFSLDIKSNIYEQFKF